MTQPGSAGGVPAISPWFRAFWRVAAVFWLVMLGVEIRATLQRGVEAFPRQHLHGVLIEVGGLLLALSFLSDRRSVRWTMMGLASLSLGVNVVMVYFLN